MTRTFKTQVFEEYWLRSPFTTDDDEDCNKIRLCFVDSWFTTTAMQSHQTRSIQFVIDDSIMIKDVFAAYAKLRKIPLHSLDFEYCAEQISSDTMLTARELGMKKVEIIIPILQAHPVDEKSISPGKKPWPHVMKGFVDGLMLEREASNRS